jgi:glycosyltransferase involved in cell wall biosynthesis
MSLPNPLSLSVFFPCYNEAGNIERVVNEAVSILENLQADFEIIVVDDGSSDRTSEIVNKINEKDSRIRLVRHKQNKGYGAALQSGFKASTKELIFYSDGDGQFDLKEITKLLDKIGDCDIVSGYRINRRDNIIRKINGWGWTKLCCLLFGLNLRDIDCAFKVYRREVFDKIEMVSTGALIDTEILARAARKGFRITEVGVHHYPRLAGEQTGADLKVIFRAFAELFKLYRVIKKQNIIADNADYR